ncbi:HAD family hydrolase [Lactobacillus alvi]|uniref:HAD family hydrolase n=1 Tax=Limosilactobacillus alvi TaxID=990412 RepID=A0ABS2EN19_9LACO|nr:Cof-type HAD-IIB family hydrolase [Limosilactobacillus alvi]MBM6753904.1 HAD family hydrolase [Limosilactobacillus alvi]
MPLPFKAVAFDMDGTFLRDDKSFDKDLFNHLFSELTAKDVHVIVASGDPAQVLLPYFDQPNDLTVVAENGAQIIDHGQEIITSTLDYQLATEVVAFLTNQLDIWPTLAGKEIGYFPPHQSVKYLEHMAFYYPKHQVLSKMLPLPDDEYFQISFLVADNEVAGIKAQIDAHFEKQLVVTPSGNGSMDLTKPGINKGWALNKLLNQWGLTGNDLIAFGDGGNDISMLKLAKFAYAMPNGSAAVKAVANHHVPVDNNHDGVLKILAQYLEN